MANNKSILDSDYTAVINTTPLLSPFWIYKVLQAEASKQDIKHQVLAGVIAACTLANKDPVKNSLEHYLPRNRNTIALLYQNS